MIKSKLKQGRRTAYFIGITQDEVRRLKHHRPIVITGEELGLNADIILAYKKTDQDLLASLPPNAQGFFERTKEKLGKLLPGTRADEVQK